MKNIISLLFISLLFITGCHKETSDVSLIVQVGHPQIVLNGPEIVSMSVGAGTYTDAGAVGYDDINKDSVPLSTPISNDVDVNTPGFYSVRYSFSNSNGYVNYTATKSRLVLVTPVDPNQDFSGTFARTANGQTVNVVKRGPGLYTTDNVGGVGGDPSYIFDVYFGVLNDSTIAVPSQPNPLGGEVYCENTSLSLSPDTSFSWIVRGAGFGAAQRTFVRQ